MMKEIYEECIHLTKKLVSIPSINSTKGEADIADAIYDYFQALPFFQQHPGQVWFDPLNDSLGRKNVFAFLEAPVATPKTVIIHGHIDTVDIDNYGDLAPYAFDCDRLLEKMKERIWDREVMADLESGEYMVGRGVCDEKSGLALGMVLVRYYSEHREQMKGNLLFMGNPGEELQHNGIMHAIGALQSLKEERKLHFKAAINMDCSNPHYVHDPNHYIYFGTVGKILPCFYILGKETHIGQCFNGIDALQIASRLINHIELNMDYADSYQDEMTLPPCVLRYQDSKTHYSVNTVSWAYCYFNFLLYRTSPREIMEKLMHETRRIVDETLGDIEEKYRSHCMYNHREYEPLHYYMDIMTYEDLYQKAMDQFASADELDRMISDLVREKQKMYTDTRDIARLVVQKLTETCGITENAIIVFLAPPYMPHSTMREENSEEKKLADSIRSAVKLFHDENGKPIHCLYYYPSLADSSYLKIDDDSRSIPFVEHNTPAYGDIGYVPVEEIRYLQIPALNMGCYGKDPHRNTERLNVRYSFQYLPEIIRRVLDVIWQSEN